MCSHYNGVFRCAALLNSDLSITNADVSLTGFDIPGGEYVKQIKFSGQLARICALFMNGSVKCVDFSSSFQVTTTYAMVINGVVEKIQSGYSNFVVAILESGAIEIMSASSVIPVTGLPSTPIVNVAFQLSNYFYVVTDDGRAYTCSLSITTGACSTVVEIEPANLDTFGKAYPDLLGNAVDVFTDLHAYPAYTFGAALLNDGTIRAWGRPDREGDVNGNVCAIGYSGNSCTTNPMQNVKQASGWADGMFILFEDGTMTRYGRYTGTNEQANTLSKKEDGNILDGIVQIASEHNGKCCAINAAGSLFCTNIGGVKDTFYLLEETPPPSPPSPPPPPPPAPPPFVLNGRTLYQDGDGWILLLAYNHVAGQNNALVPATAPQSPTESYSHIWLTDLGLTADDVESVRFYCSTSKHDRTIHFSANTDWVKTAILTGSNSGNVITNWNTGTTKLDGHTAYLPDLLSHAYNSLTDFPFFGDSTGSTNWGHWGIRGHGNRWECDDQVGNTADTLHQIWFKKSPPPSYTHYAGACVHGNNIEKFTGKTVEQCKEICSAMSNCVAFEFGVAYGGGGEYQAGDCQPQSSANSADCDGFSFNLDLYVKDSEV